jgi:hypothetical protein
MDKKEILNNLKSEYSRWMVLLGDLTENEISQNLPGENLTIKDKVAHLCAWQELSIARLDAAIHRHVPVNPAWLVSEDPDTGDVDQDNERIYQMYQRFPWQEIYSKWSSGFELFIALSELVSEDDLFVVGKFTWLPEYALADVMIGTLEHHREHFIWPLGKT